MCKLVVRSGFYEELSVPTPHLRNAHFFITRLDKIGQKPKFRQCYFLGNIKNIKIYILGHILVPVSEDPGEAAGYRPVAARLLVQTAMVSTLCTSLLVQLQDYIVNNICRFSYNFWHLNIVDVLICFYMTVCVSGFPCK